MASNDDIWIDKQNLIGFADANWAESRIDRKSTSGYLFQQATNKTVLQYQQQRPNYIHYQNQSKRLNGLGIYYWKLIYCQKKKLFFMKITQSQRKSLNRVNNQIEQNTLLLAIFSF